MLTHRGFSAWIVVDGKPLAEYLVAVDSSVNKVSCWVPSEEGKTFSVYWRDHGGKVETCGYILLDGYVAPGRFLYGEGTAWRSGIRTGQTSERPFIFQKVEENTLGVGSSTAVGKDVGMIVLKIKRVKLTSVVSPNIIQQLPETYNGHIGMRVGFGTEQPAYEQYPSTWKVESYDNPGQQKPRTYVSFIFRYRSLDFLRAQGIIDDPVSATPMQGRLPQRRVASMPMTVPRNALTPSPSPPPSVKNTSDDPVYYHLGPQRLEQPTTDSGRAASLRASVNVEETAEEKPINYPGEGLIIFPLPKPTTIYPKDGSK